MWLWDILEGYTWEQGNGHAVMGYRRGGRQEHKDLRIQLWGIENSRDGNKAVGLWLWSFERGVETGTR